MAEYITGGSTFDEGTQATRVVEVSEPIGSGTIRSVQEITLVDISDILTDLLEEQRITNMLLKGILQ